MDNQQAQPVVMQPVATSNVVTEQPREWSSGIFGCFSDIPGCIYGWSFGTCLAWSVSTRAGENCCAAHVALPAVRTKVRLMHNIQGGICNDYLCSVFFGSCVVCQLDRELKHAGL
ncbi:hypothetical protein NP493_337g02029 [Ridgeia piscesae]|uniref:Uncharacterized protein n=1 Tax=Ridgeia piscesae TaxID=27915 RepID=A0AAD9L3N1_RIDPI|nr:hypothetical protein NP493_337g02029 [Ridgeia piscesae]